MKKTTDPGSADSSQVISHDDRAPICGRVTVITAVMNASKTLDRCIESVLSQDYSDIEYILIDGGSTDGSLEIIKSYSDRVAYWQSEQDRGTYDAWNKGLDMATGEWIAFLGADDHLLPGAVSEYMQAAISVSVEYISSYVRWLHPSRGPRLIGSPWRWPEFQKYMTTAHVGSMHNYSLFRQYGKYDLAYPIVGDYEFLLRARNKLRTLFVPIISVEMQSGGMSDSVAAIYEAMRAKINTGGRGKVVSWLEMMWAVAGNYLKASLRNASAAVTDE